MKYRNEGQDLFYFFYFFLFFAKIDKERTRKFTTKENDLNLGGNRDIHSWSMIAATITERYREVKYLGHVWKVGIENGNQKSVLFVIHHCICLIRNA